MILKKTFQLTGHNAGIYTLSYGPGPKSFLSAGGDGWIVEWDLDEPEIGRLLAKVDTRVFSINLLEDHQLLVAGNMDGGVHWVDLHAPEETKNIAHHENGVFDILRIGELLYTAGGAGKLTKWSISERKSLESFWLANQSLRCLSYAPKRNEIAVGASDHAIYILDASSLALKKRLVKAHDNSVFSLRYSPDERLLFSGGRDAHLKVWETAADFKQLSSQPAHWFTINDLVFHPNGHLLASASRDKTVKVWDAESFELLKVLELNRDGGHLNSVNRLLWHPYKNTLISCSDDRTIILWETAKTP